jgi:hypothetical protein
VSFEISNISYVTCKHCFGTTEKPDPTTGMPYSISEDMKAILPPTPS